LIIKANQTAMDNRNRILLFSSISGASFSDVICWLSL